MCTAWPPKHQVCQIFASSLDSRPALYESQQLTCWPNNVQECCAKENAWLDHAQHSLHPVSQNGAIGNFTTSQGACSIFCSCLCRLGSHAQPPACMQMEREQMLTINLKALLRRYVEGDELGFRVSHQSCNLELVPMQHTETSLHLCL